MIVLLFAYLALSIVLFFITKKKAIMIRILISVGVFIILSASSIIILSILGDNPPKNSRVVNPDEIKSSREDSK
jgi:hypothetical protein